MKTLHFGIEMEMTGITREKAANLMAGFFGTGRGTYEGGAYDTYTALDNQGRTWKAMSDSSIRPQRKVGGVYDTVKIPTVIIQKSPFHQGNFLIKSGTP